MTYQLCVLIVEDHPIFCSALARAIALEPEITVVGAFLSPQIALSKIENLPVDVIITDLSWQGDPVHGFDFIRKAKNIMPQAKIIVCSAHDSKDIVRQAIRIGTDGYLLKSEIEIDDIVYAVKSVHRDVPVYSNTITQIITSWLREQGQKQPVEEPLDTLTAHERKVADLILKDLNDDEIARRLNIAFKIVKGYVSSILRKLGLSSRSQVKEYFQSQTKSYAPGAQTMFPE